MRYNNGILHSSKEKQNHQFVATWMKLGNIVLNKNQSERKGQVQNDLSQTWNLKETKQGSNEGPEATQLEN